MTQVEFVQKIMYLAAANPEAEIKVCVDNEFADDYGWTAHKITRVELSEWIPLDERIYTDEDLAKDEILDMLFDAEKHGGLSDSEFEAMVDKYYRQHVVDAICIHTSAA